MPVLISALPLAAATATTVAAAAARGFGRRGPSPQLALCASLVAILLVTLSPQDGANQVQEFPFAEIASAARDPNDLGLAAGVAGNVLLFAPLGAALACCGISLRWAVAIGGATSIVVECLQLAVPGRTSAVDDVLLNTAGTAVGFYATAIALRAMRRTAARRSTTRL